MDPYIAFLVEHWMLTAAFGAVLVLLALNEWRHRSLGVSGISPQQLVDLLNHADATVVDVRTQARFELGHILNAISIPQENFGGSLKVLNKYKSKPIILVCATGLESPKMGKILKGNGFTQLYHLAGGMEAWHAQGMPVVKK